MKKSKVWGLRSAQFRTYPTSLMVTIVWYWCEDRQTDQWNKTESLEIDPHVHYQLIFIEGAQPVKWENKIFSAEAAITS